MVATRVVLPGLIIIRDVGIEVLCAMRVDMVGGVRKRLSLFGMHIGHHQQIAEKERDKRKKSAEEKLELLAGLPAGPDVALRRRY